MKDKIVETQIQDLYVETKCKQKILYGLLFTQLVMFKKEIILFLLIKNFDNNYQYKRIWF